MNDATGSADLHSPLFSTAFVQNTHVQDARCEVYDTPYEKSAKIRSRVLPARPKPGQGAAQTSRQPGVMDITKRRFALNQHLRKAKACAERLSAAGDTDDFFARNVSGADLLTALEALWRCSDVREEAWRSSVDTLQQTLQGQELGSFSVEQCRAIRDLVVDVLGGGAVDDEDEVALR